MALVVYLYINTKDFSISTRMTHSREQVIGAYLARHFDSSICFNGDDKKLDHYDFTLYSTAKGWLYTMEMQDDYFIQNLDSTLLIETTIYNKDGTTKPGKLFKTKAQKLCLILNKLKRIFICDMKILKSLVIRLEKAGQLKTTTPGDFDTWKKEKDTLPTTCAIVQIQDLMALDPKASVIEPDPLIFNDYAKNRFIKNND